MGLSGIVDQHEVLVGNMKLMDHSVVQINIQHRSLVQDWTMDGCTVILVAVDGMVSELVCMVL